MAISLQKARALCTKTEYDLVKWSTPKQVKTLTAARLKQKLDRTRKLRDKFKKLARQQAGEARGKRKPTGTRPAKSNQRTVEKVDLFNETLERFEKALARAEKTQSTSDSGAARKKTKTGGRSTKATGGKPTNSPKSHKKSDTSAKSKRRTPARSSVKPVSITADDGGGGSGGSGLFADGFGASLAEQASREVRRQNRSKSSKGARERNRFSRTASEKIQGHVSAQTRRAQAKRDAK